MTCGNTGAGGNPPSSPKHMYLWNEFIVSYLFGGKRFAGKPEFRFLSKPPHRKLLLEIKYDSDIDLTRIMEELSQMGWFVVETQKLEKAKAVLITAKGNDLFGDWTNEDKEKRIKEIGQVLCPYGIDGLFIIKLKV